MQRRVVRSVAAPAPYGTGADACRAGGCAHCSVSALRKIEGDERRPSHRLAERLAACLQVPAAERPSLVKIARGERRIDGLEELSAVALPAPVL